MSEVARTVPEPLEVHMHTVETLAQILEPTEKAVAKRNVSSVHYYATLKMGTFSATDVVKRNESHTQ